MVNKPTVQPKKSPKQKYKGKYDAVTDLLMREYAPASVLVNHLLEPLRFIGNSKRFLRLPEGNADFNLLSLCLPSIRSELRALLLRCQQNSKLDVVDHLVQIKIDNEPLLVRLAVRPIGLSEDKTQALLISFEEEKSNIQVAENDLTTLTEIERSQVKDLERELAGTREHLQAVIEELETTNEELQSYIEELQAAGEELQASNEELETTNEELQATNEELTTVNDELGAKTEELSTTNDTLNNVQQSVNLGLVVVDRHARITLYNKSAVRVFGLMPDDVGQNLLGAPCYFLIPDLRRKIDDVIATDGSLIETISRENVHFLMQITPYKTQSEGNTGAVLTFLDVSDLHATEQRFRMITESLQEVVWMSTLGMEKMLYISPNFERLWKRSLDDIYTDPKTYFNAIHADDRDKIQNLLSTHRKGSWDLKYRLLLPDGSERWIHDHGSSVIDHSNETAYLVGNAIDITRQIKAEEKRQFITFRFKSVFENLAVGLFLLDDNGLIIQANRAFANMLGYQVNQLENRHLGEIAHPEDVTICMSEFNELVSRRSDSFRMDNRFLDADGGFIWARLTLNYHRTSLSKDKFAVAVVEDITEQKQRENLIYHQANFDPLTELPNRNLLMDRLTGGINNSARSSLPCFVLFIDLDQFKEINDAHGHRIGDSVLLEVAARLKSVCRVTDTVARFGGDEFVVVVNQIQTTEAVERITQMILETLRHPIETSAGKFYLSASIGIAKYPDDTDEAGKLIQFADIAMYAAKKNGGNGFRYFSSHMNESLSERATIKEQIKIALAENQFELFLQPVQRLSDGLIVSSEALLRWHHPQHGLMMPGRFVPYAEEGGQIIELGSWVVHAAVDIAEKTSKLGTDFRIAFNLSPKQFQDKSFRDLTTIWKPIASHLIMEITETVMLEMGPNLVNALEEFRQVGGQVSIDDFGTGYSNLSYLQDYPIDIIKIDQSFIRRIDENKKTKELVKAIIGIGDSLGAKIIAEGVEFEKQKDFLMQFDNIHIQGFFLAKPMSLKQFETFYQSQSQSQPDLPMN